MKSILHRENLKLIYFFGLFSFVFFLLFYINNLLLSCVLAFVVYYLLSPIVNFLERNGITRGVATALVFFLNGILLITILSIFIPLLIDQLAGLEEDLPRIRNGLTTLVEKFELRISNIFHIEGFGVINSLSHWLIDQTSEYSSRIPRWISDSLTTVFLTGFIGFFMLRDGTSLKRALLQFVPNSLFELFMNLFHEMNEQIGSFIRARIFEAVIVGIVTYLGLLFINFPFAILLALFAAVTNLIPYLGPIAGAIPAAIIILVNPEVALGTLGMNILAVAIVYLTAQLLDAFFIIPIVVAKIVNLHPVTVILVIILGAQVMGILGMIISIPVTSLAKLVLNTVYQHSLRSGAPVFYRD